MPRLIYTSDQEPGISRKGAGRGFYYVHPNGKRVKNKAKLERIASLAIPPAYRNVWICPNENGHLQATGVDARKRKQYRYHPHWHELQKREKFDRLREVGVGLPTLRRKVRSLLREFDGSRDAVIATAVRLIDKTGFRVGNETYLDENKSRGISTLAPENVEIDQSIHLEFVAKGGREVDTEFSDSLLETALQKCHELPGQRLFTYRDGGGRRHSIDSGQINDFLREQFGGDVTSKDLRTWHASTAAVDFLRKIRSPKSREEEFRDAVKYAADEIRNRYATCLKHYIHPRIESAYAESGHYGFSRLRPKPAGDQQIAEAILLKLLG